MYSFYLFFIVIVKLVLLLRCYQLCIGQIKIRDSIKDVFLRLFYVNDTVYLKVNNPRFH